MVKTKIPFNTTKLFLSLFQLVSKVLYNRCSKSATMESEIEGSLTPKLILDSIKDKGENRSYYSQKRLEGIFNLPKRSVFKGLPFFKATSRRIVIKTSRTRIITIRTKGMLKS